MEDMNLRLAGTVSETRKLMEDYAQGEVVTLTEPGSGVEALFYRTPDGVAPISRMNFDDWRDNPRRIAGTAVLLTLDSFIAHANRFKDLHSAVFAIDDRKAPSLQVVYDYHEPANSGEIEPHIAVADADDIARHQAHRATFAFPLSDEWIAWRDSNGKVMRMAEFAHFLEDRIVDVLDLIPGEDSPSEELQKFINLCGGTIASPARLIELSRGLQVHESAAVKEVVNLSSGEGQIGFAAEHHDGTGQALKIPGLFLIGIPVFRAGQFYRLAARLRYRKTGEGIVFWYELWRPDRTFDDAFNQACERVKVETDLPLFVGRPE